MDYQTALAIIKEACAEYVGKLNQHQQIQSAIIFLESRMPNDEGIVTEAPEEIVEPTEEPDREIE